MSGISNMRLRTRQSGGSVREEKVIDARRMEAYDNENDPSYNPYVFFWVPGEHPHKGDRVHLRLYGRSYSAANGVVMKFQSLSSERIETGDYIYDERDSETWICTEAFNIDGIHYSGKFTRCQWALKWITPDGRIVEYPVQDINSTQYNTGETRDRSGKFTLGSAQHLEVVQATEDTMAVASPQRFYISRTNAVPFIVTQNDTTSSNYGKGLCRITVTQDVANPDTDNPELGICDYYTGIRKRPRPLPPPHETDGVFAAIHGEPYMRIFYPREYSVDFKNRHGEPVDDVEYVWDVVSDIEVLQEVDGNEISLLVKGEENCGSSVLLQVLIGGEVAARKKITVIGGL